MSQDRRVTIRLAKGCWVPSMGEGYGRLDLLGRLAAKELATPGLTAGLIFLWVGGLGHCPPGLGRVQGH